MWARIGYIVGEGEKERKEDQITFLLYTLTRCYVTVVGDRQNWE